MENKKEIKKEMNIYQKVFTIHSEIDSIQKDKGGYHGSALKLNTILKKLNPLLEKYKVLVIGSSKIISENGNKVIGAFTLKIIDMENPIDKIISEHAFGGNDANISFAIGKASTYARKYALMEFFNLGASEDPDFQQRKTFNNQPKQKVNYDVNPTPQSWGGNQ